MLQYFRRGLEALPHHAPAVGPGKELTRRMYHPNTRNVKEFFFGEIKNRIGRRTADIRGIRERAVIGGKDHRRPEGRDILQPAHLPAPHGAENDWPENAFPNDNTERSYKRIGAAKINPGSSPDRIQEHPRNREMMSPHNRHLQSSSGLRPPTLRSPRTSPSDGRHGFERPRLLAASGLR